MWLNNWLKVLAKRYYGVVFVAFLGLTSKAIKALPV